MSRTRGRRSAPITETAGGISGARRADFHLLKFDRVERKPPQRTIKWQVCEHVAFNQEIVRRGGRLYILPDLIIRATTGIEFTKSFHRSLVF